MLLRISVAAMNRWHELTHPKESDRGDSPVPTIIIWVGVATIAIGLLAWAGAYISARTGSAPTAVPTMPPGQGTGALPNGPGH